MKLSAMMIVILINLVELARIRELSEPRHQHYSSALRHVRHEDKLSVLDLNEQSGVVIESHVGFVRRLGLAQHSKGVGKVAEPAGEVLFARGLRLSAAAYGRALFADGSHGSELAQGFAAGVVGRQSAGDEVVGFGL